jgi:hypothetical protein
MTLRNSDFEDALRHALHAAADRVEPAGDGLTQIQDKLAAPWPVRRVSLLVTGWIDLARRITIWLEPACPWARPGPAAIRRPPPEPVRRIMSPRARPWPALAVAGVAITALAGALMLTHAAAIISLITTTRPGTTGLAGAGPANGGQLPFPPGGPSRTSSSQNNPVRPGTVPARGGRTAHQPPCAAAACPRPGGTPPMPTPAVTPSVTVSPIQSPAPTPTPTPTPAPTPTHSPHGHHQHRHHRHRHHGHHPGR